MQTSVGSLDRIVEVHVGHGPSLDHHHINPEVGAPVELSAVDALVDVKCDYEHTVGMDAIYQVSAFKLEFGPALARVISAGRVSFHEHRIHMYRRRGRSPGYKNQRKGNCHDRESGQEGSLQIDSTAHRNPIPFFLGRAGLTTGSAGPR